MAADHIRMALGRIAEGAADPWPLVDEVVNAALALGTPRGYDLYLVWTNFYDQTTESGGEQAAKGAMPLAATEWLESEGDDDAERAYLVKWFDYHGLRTQPG
jgi:hypothetical protein